MPHPQRVLALGLVASFGAAVLVRVSNPVPPPPPAAPPVLAAAYAAPAEVAFADTLARGETLSELLERAQVHGEQAAALLAELEAYQDARDLQPGAVIRVRASSTTGAVRAVEFAVDPDRRLTVERAAGEWHGAVEEVPVRTDTATLVGRVESSLYQALLDARGERVPRAEREQIADLLADRVFAWQIDFARDLRPGDRCRVVVERAVRPDGTARSTRVLGAWFDLDGHEYDAFLFGTGEGEHYYDRDGESLRRAFLRAPLEFRRISSAFSTSRFHPVLKRARPHHGIDYAAARGTPVRAVGDGRIAKAGWGGGYGNVVEIRHRRGYASRYAHLRGFAEGIRPGTQVTQGEVIGYVGTTGLSTGPHLHYEFHEDGCAVDPNSVRYLTGDPVPEARMAAFRQVARARLAAMERADAARYAASDPPTTGRSE